MAVYHFLLGHEADMLQLWNHVHLDDLRATAALGNLRQHIHRLLSPEALGGELEILAFARIRQVCALVISETSVRLINLHGFLLPGESLESVRLRAITLIYRDGTFSLFSEPTPPLLWQSATFWPPELAQTRARLNC